VLASAAAALEVLHCCGVLTALTFPWLGLCCIEGVVVVGLMSAATGYSDDVNTGESSVSVHPGSLLAVAGREFWLWRWHCHL